MDGSRVAEEEPGDAAADSPIASRSAGCTRMTDPAGNQRRLNSGSDQEASVCRRRRTGSMCRIEGSSVGLQRTSHEGRPMDGSRVAEEELSDAAADSPVARDLG
jgi:hypothetical protein